MNRNVLMSVSLCGLLCVLPSGGRADSSRYRYEERKEQNEIIMQELHDIKAQREKERAERTIRVEKQLSSRRSRSSTVNLKTAVSAEGRVDRRLLANHEEKVDKGGHRLLISVLLLGFLGGVAWLVRRLTQE